MDWEEKGFDLEAMMRQYGDRLLRLCFLYLQDRGLAEDAVQDTFLKAYRKRDKFRGDCNEKTWLTRIAINTCKNDLRAPWKRRVDVVEQIPEPLNIPSHPGESLISEIVKLPLKYREVLLLYYYQELEIREIAGIQHTAESTVYTRLKRARAMLKDRLERWDLHA